MEESNKLKCLYAILECPQTASHAEMKKSYQNLILKHHPDKSSDPHQNTEFLRIDKAWKVLRDPELRRKYDAEQKQMQFANDMIINETVMRDDFMVDEITGDYFRPCRCGGEYWLEAEDLVHQQEQLYLNCSECSLSIEIILKGDSKS